MRHSRGDPSPDRRRLPGPVRFLIRMVSTAMILALTIAFLPYVTRWAGQLWPDPSRTERVSEILRHELKESARLETMTVDDDGVLTATVQAALIGEVQRVTIEYTYHASIGVDLEQVRVTAEGGTVALKLPAMEILSDSLTPTHIDRQDFWYPLTEKRRDQLLSEEREKRAQAALADARNNPEIRKKMTEKLQRLIQSWIGADTWLVTVEMTLPEEET